VYYILAIFNIMARREDKNVADPSKVRVLVRVRPYLKQETGQPCVAIIHEKEHTSYVQLSNLKLKAPEAFRYR
jgi:hypothetical protein